MVSHFLSTVIISLQCFTAVEILCYYAWKWAEHVALFLVIFQHRLESCPDANRTVERMAGSKSRNVPWFRYVPRKELIPLCTRRQYRFMGFYSIFACYNLFITSSDQAVTAASTCMWVSNLLQQHNP